MANDFSILFKSSEASAELACSDFAPLQKKVGQIKKIPEGNKKIL